MHVGLILPSYSDRDSMQIPSVSLLATRLSGEIDVTVIPFRNPPGATAAPGSPVNVLNLNGTPSRFRELLRTAIDAIRERHQVQPFDLLHGYWLFEPGFVAAVAGRLLRIPVVASIGGAELASLPEIGYGGMRSTRGRLLNRTILAAATLITGGSRYVVDLARQVSPASRPKLRVVPLPVNAEPATNQPINPYLRGSEIDLLQVGAYLPVKGQDISIRALATLLRTRDDLRLTLIGEDPRGYRRRMRDLARNLGITGHVNLLERIPHDALAGYYRHSDLLLMPSRHESQGMVVLEAAAHGLVTVGSNVGVVGDLAPEAAVAVPSGDVNRLADEIGSLLLDQERRSRVGLAAQKKVRHAYALEPVVERWIAIYKDAFNGE